MRRSHTEKAIVTARQGENKVMAIANDVLEMELEPAARAGYRLEIAARARRVKVDTRTAQTCVPAPCHIAQRERPMARWSRVNP